MGHPPHGSQPHHYIVALPHHGASEPHLVSEDSSVQMGEGTHHNPLGRVDGQRFLIVTVVPSSFVSDTAKSSL